MSVRNINHLEFGPIAVTSAGNTIHVGVGGSVLQGTFDYTTYTGAISENPNFPKKSHDNSYIIDGWIAHGISSLVAYGSDDRVQIGATGHATGGHYGIWLGGGDNKLDNMGEISAGNLGTGVATLGQNARIHNDGIISGGIGLDISGEGSLVVNGLHGVIAGETFGIGEELTNTGNVKYINHGQIIGSSGIAIQMVVKALNLTNDGTIRGDIYSGIGVSTLDNHGGVIRGDVNFGSGGGTLDNRGGVIKGAVYGNTGSDILITDNAKCHLIEQADHGIDTVKSSVSYTLDSNVERLTLLGKADVNGTGTVSNDLLRGNDGDNTLKGLDGVDTLIGGKGDDILLGGGDADMFSFATGYGHDTIRDFTALDGDVVNVRGWTAIDVFSKLVSHATNHGDNLWITVGHDRLVIDHLHKADLVDTDFLF